MPFETDIILSLVRTRSIGYLRSVRRLTVALSRARLGLYILGRRSVFESVFELKPAFDILLQRPFPPHNHLRLFWPLAINGCVCSLVFRICASR